MNDIFENQKEKLLAIKHEISLLHQQVNYLLRNEKPLGLLDLDVLMNRTHTVYDLLCSINLGENGDDEEMDIDSEAFSSLFAPMMQGNEDTEEKVETPAQEEPDSILYSSSVTISTWELVKIATSSPISHLLYHNSGAGSQ